MSGPIWAGRRVLLTLGTGGVGKTTVSACLGLAAAAAGKRTLVMTIDPARRLANALGLKDAGNQAQQVPNAALEALGQSAARLDVMMPDVKSTFDALVQQLATGPKQAEAVLNHPLYAHFTSALAGSHEYAAIEQLYAALTSEAYDCIVLDTPPAQQAISFLEAPDKVLAFLELQEGIPTWLRRPGRMAGRLSAKVLDLGGSVIFAALERLAGAEILHQLADFLAAVQDLLAGFKARARRIQGLLGDPSLGCIWVSAPGAAAEGQLAPLQAALKSRQMAICAAVVNRVHPRPADAAESQTLMRFLATQGLSNDAQAQARLLLERAQRRAERDAAQVAQRRAATQVPVASLPELPPGSDALQALVQLLPHLAPLTEPGPP